jgi:glucan phosphoethanolaminetransferase (alkaline phosphatase superfamily)
VRQFNYQRNKYATIKGIVWMILHGVTISWIIVQVPVFVKTEFGSKTDQVIVFISIFFLWALLSLIFELMPFGSVIKPISNNEFIMYRQVAWFRWNIQRRPIPRQEDIRIVQDPDRYYKIVIGFDQGNILAMDKFPTLDNATKYLDELRSVLR